MTDSTVAPPIRHRFARWARNDSDTRGALSVADVIDNVRKATVSRLGFAVVMAALSTTVLPISFAIAWLAFLAGWELALRPWIEDRFAVAARGEAGFHCLAAIHFVGGLAYTLYPVMAWLSGEPLGMVLATAWICGSANHVFVYFAPNRLLVAACLAPLTACALAAPFATAGFTLSATVGAAALAALILAAAMFGQDRRVLLGNLAKQAAARAAAEQANAAKSRFLATMSHELRTPLNAVIGYAELIEEEAEGRIAGDAGKIRGSARQLLSVIDTILDLSKLESGTVELERERIDASAVLEQVRESAPAMAAVHGNKLAVEEITPLGEAVIDQRRLYQCLMQLVGNAAKFTRDGDIRVTGSRRVVDGRVRLSFTVADTGVGIAPDMQARIFDPFVQAEGESDRRFEGSGLGLTFVQRLARLMDGDVSCESSPGKGSAFTLRVDGGPSE